MIDDRAAASIQRRWLLDTITNVHRMKKKTERSIRHMLQYSSRAANAMCHWLGERWIPAFPLMAQCSATHNTAILAKLAITNAPMLTYSNRLLAIIHLIDIISARFCPACCESRMWAEKCLRSDEGKSFISRQLTHVMIYLRFPNTPTNRRAKHHLFCGHSYVLTRPQMCRLSDVP